MLSVTPKDGPDGRLQLHASTVVFTGKAIAFVGPSGSGKSGHALALLSHGATLLADDITWLHATPNALIATCPSALSGRIEARGVGILNAVPAPPAPLALIVDLGTPEHDRLPPFRTVDLLGRSIAILHNPDTPHFVAAIMQYMSQGRAE